jgi:hypothetical protein
MNAGKLSAPYQRVYTKANQMAAAMLKTKVPGAALDEADDSGILLVAAPPMYQEPISVSSPFCVNMAALAPTLETSERKAPK